MPTVTLEQLRREAGQKALPVFKAGQTVRVHQKIREKDNKERIQIFQGIIIEVSNGRGVNGSITVRKISEGIGVEKVFPIHSPFIEKIELVKEAKVRRSRIFFMRDRRGKSARLQERFFSDEDLKAMMPHEVTEEELQEAVKHQEEEEAKEEASEQTTEDTSEEAEKEAGTAVPDAETPKDEQEKTEDAEETAEKTE